VFTVSGTFCVYLGYKLFVKGLFNEAGDLTASSGNKKLIIKKAAPGTFFALFGAIIISINVYRASYDHKSGIDFVRVDSTKANIPIIALDSPHIRVREEITIDSTSAKNSLK
jgi:hypothetical protein